MADLGRILGFAEVVTPTTGGLNTTGSVTLSSAAPAGGTVVNLTSSNTSVATVPASTTVAAGQTKSPSFTITTFVVSAQTQVTISGNAGRALVRLQAKLAELAADDCPDGFSALPLFAALRAADNAFRPTMSPGRFGDDLDRLFAAIPAIIEEGLRASAPLTPRDIEGWLSHTSSHVPQPVVGVTLNQLRAHRHCSRGDVAAVDWILRRVPLPLSRRYAKRFRRLRRWTGSSRLAARLIWAWPRS